MKRVCCFLASYLMLLACTAAAQDVVIAEVDSLYENDMLLPEEREALNAEVVNAAIAGVWHYDKPSVQAQGSSIIGKLGKPIAKSKLKKKLNKAFKKLKINKRWNSLTLTPQGHWTINIAGVNMGGNYSYNPEEDRITLKWHGIPMSSKVLREGKHLHLLFDTDHLLNVLRIISGFSHSETLKAIAFLSQNYSDVMVGFDLKQ
ncbi:MAG: DUF4923 family protein [Muribaculaceae bacterium]|nr:DUF4923 family protein [Muribaculaceae bacterium]